MPSDRPRNALISEIVGNAYPTAVTKAGRASRNWIARTEAPLPGQPVLTESQRRLEEEAFAAIEAAYRTPATTDQLKAARPTIVLFRLDDNHLVIRTEFAVGQVAVSDSAAISQWGVILSLNRELKFEELQGLPCHYWFPLRAGSASADR